MCGISVAELRTEVVTRLADVRDGEELDDRSSALARLAVVASPTTLVHEAVFAEVGRRAIQQVLEIASATTLHPGVR